MAGCARESLAYLSRTQSRLCRLECTEQPTRNAILFLPMTPISPLELAAIHEAAHAVMTVNCRWHFICDSVSVNPQGHGSAPFQMNNATARAEMLESGNADRVFLKAAVIAAAGVCAENRIRRERGDRQLSVEQAFLVSDADVRQAEFALGNMVNPVPLVAVVEQTQALIDSNEAAWKTICRFAELLQESRTFTSSEATEAILRISREISNPADE